MKESSRLRGMLLPIVLLVFVFISGCVSKKQEHADFVDVGEFAIKALGDGSKEIRDGQGRRLVLVPRGQKPPDGYLKGQIIETPVRRVVAYSTHEVSMFRALGVLDALVGVTTEKCDWTVREVVRRMDEGRISFLGDSFSVDFERLKAACPEVVFTWDQSAIPMLDRMGIPTVITYTGTAMDLETRIRFIQFLAPFFGKEEKADLFVQGVLETIAEIRERTADVAHRPKVIWGDIYEKRVLVEPGNSWVAEMIKLAGGDYLFEDIRGSH